MKRWHHKGFFILLCLGFLISCRSASKGELILAMDWSANTNHIAIMTALGKGFYKEEGLSLKLVDFGKTGALSLVSKNQAQLGLSSVGEIIFAKSKGAPIISVARLFDHNPSGFYSLDSSGILSPKDLQGKIYGGWGSSMEEAMIKALIRKGGVTNPSFENRTIGSSNILLALKNVDFIWGFVGWQGVQIELSKKPYHFLPTAQYIPTLADYAPLVVVNTDSDFYKNESAKIRKFLRATDKGARWAKEHPKEAIDFLLTYDETLSVELVSKSAHFLIPRMFDTKGHWGKQEYSRFKGYLDFVKEQGLITEPLEAKELFTNSFLPQEEIK